MITRPMLAEEVKDVNQLTWPMIASPKVDGIRCLNVGGHILARSFKLIPNAHIRETLKNITAYGCDGELTTSDSFNQCTSDIMSRNGEPKFNYWVFDLVVNSVKTPYVERLRMLAGWYKGLNADAKKIVKLLPFKVINSLIELEKYMKETLDKGYEGVCLRTPNSPYKCGRSTWKERYLLKMKVFVDSEAVILSMEEQRSNQNEMEKNELGLAKRSHKKEGMVATGMLGKFLARDLSTGVEFKCGSGQGLTQELRTEIWKNKDAYVGKIFKYKYQPHGVKDLPRIPIWMGFRDEIDMD
jgi:DNA ligase-1